MFYVYKLTSPNNKVYIGVTKNLNTRFKNYQKLQCKSQYLIYRSLNKYGWDFFKKEVLFIFEYREDALNKEKELIKYFKGLKCSLNISDGGEWCILTGKNNPLSKEIYQFTQNGKFLKKWDSMSQVEKNLGIKVSELSSACNKKTFYCKQFFWCFEKDLHKISFNRQIGKTGKYIYQLDSSFNIINEFSSVKNAAKNTSINYYGILNCLYKKVKTYQGFYWVFKEYYSSNLKEILDKLPDQKLPKRGIKIYRNINNTIEVFNSITEACKKCNIGKLKLKQLLDYNGKYKIWFYE